jgi:hypothetical protein
VYINRLNIKFRDKINKLMVLQVKKCVYEFRQLIRRQGEFLLNNIY